MQVFERCLKSPGVSWKGSPMMADITVCPVMVLTGDDLLFGVSLKVAWKFVGRADRYRSERLGAYFPYSDIIRADTAYPLRLDEIASGLTAVVNCIATEELWKTCTVVMHIASETQGSVELQFRDKVYPFTLPDDVMADLRESKSLVAREK